VGNALATTKPFVPAGLIAAGVAAVQTAAQVAVIKSQKFDGGGGGATAISAGTGMQRVLATPVGASTLQPSASPAAAAAASGSNMLTADQIASAIAAMPPPIVTVEDINARASEKQKVEVRATI